MAVEQYKATAQDIIDSVFRQFGDESGAQITQADIIRWINEAQRDVVVNNREVNQAIAEFAVTVGTTIYDLPSLVPDILRVHSIYFDNKLLDSISFEESQVKCKEEDATGGPQYWFKFAGQLNLWPAPEADLEAGIKVFYNRSPVAVTQGTDILSVPESYYEAVNSFCLGKAYELDGDAQMLGIKKEDYNRNLTINSMDTAVSHRDYPTIREVDY